jgi:hypothetical protein
VIVGDSESGVRVRGDAYQRTAREAGRPRTKQRRKATSTLPVTNKIESRGMDRGVHHIFPLLLSFNALVKVVSRTVCRVLII